MKKLSVLPVLASLFALSACQSTPLEPTMVTPTATVIPNEWKTFTKANVFTMQYPNDFRLITEAGQGGSFVGPSIAKFSFPENAFKEPPTNFNEAYVLVSASQDSEDRVTCTDFEDIPNTANQLDNVVINDITFATAHVTDAAAGNIYESTLYRTLHKEANGKSKCYELAVTLHTGNISNYDAPVTEFDKEKALTTLQKIVSSFEFSA